MGPDTRPRPDGPADVPPGARLTELLARLRTTGWWGPWSRTPTLAWRLGLGGLVGRSLAVLTTTGQRTGEPRRTVVTYIPAGERAYVAALYGPGSQWFRNLIADPRVSLQTTGAPRAMLARRTASDDDLQAAYADLHARLGPGTDPTLAALGAPGGLDGLLTHRDQVLLIRLDPTGEPAPPGVRADLVWVGPAVLGLLALLRWRRRR